MLVCYMERLAMKAMDYGIKIEFNIRLINLLIDAEKIQSFINTRKNSRNQVCSYRQATRSECSRIKTSPSACRSTRCTSRHTPQP